MYRNKKDVDKHVENYFLSKLSAEEFKSRAYSVARLYFEVGDYANCQKYVEQYLTQKDNNAAAYKLLGQALQKMGLKEKALEQYKASLDIDPAQASTILDICELLADDEVIIEPGRAKYWCEKAEATFPRHPITFRLREKLIAVTNPDPEALVNLLSSELAIRPKDAFLHALLLKHYLNINKVKEAFEHACNVEFGGKAFINNYGWYEVLNNLLKHNSLSTSDWLYQLLLLTVHERICLLSITETPSGPSKSLVESNELLHAYDQAIESVAKEEASPGFAEFHNGLLQHHRGQVAFHAATFLLKKAKKDQMNWSDAAKFAAPLMLVAWETVPLDAKVNWLRNAPDKQSMAVNRWYSEGTYRCSQAGHYLLSNIQDKNQSFLDQVSQCFSGTHWRDKLYIKVFASKGHLDKMKSSYFASNAFTPPVPRLPRRIEVESFDGDAQREYGSSLHHFVWTLLNYKDYAHFKCTLFDMLTYNATTCGPETLYKSDIHAFLYCATLTAKQQISKKGSYITSDKPSTLPANITDMLCSLAQMKWWDCAYKFSQNELGTELTDIRATLSRGIEVVRCIDNHGLDPELLCTLGRIFSERAKTSTDVDEKAQLEIRASLYYSSAVPLLEKLKRKIVVKFLEKRMFDYTHKELGTKELNALLEECKLYVTVNHFTEGEYDKVNEIFSNLKLVTSQASYHLSQTYKKIAQEENNLSRDSETKSKVAALLSKARMFAYKALDRLRDSESNKNHPLYTETQELIEEIETHMNKIDSDLSAVINDGDGKYSSDENMSGGSEQGRIYPRAKRAMARPWPIYFGHRKIFKYASGSEHLPMRTNSRIFRNISSTPKAASNANAPNYRAALVSQILENTRIDQHNLERIENEIKNLQKRDTTNGVFMDQTRNWFDENRKLGTIHSNMQNTTDQFKLLNISVHQVKDQIDGCRNECKDVGQLKKQVAELKKEVSKLKKASSEQTVDDSDLYNLDEEYRTNDSTSSRIVNYPGVYPTPDKMYLDVAHLVPPTVPAAPTVPPVPVVPTLSTVPTIPPVPTVAVPPPVTSVTISKTTSSVESKDISRSLPVNVVITSSDPLPTCTTTPAPILSVTIPPKHIKGTPHNYQIPMPSTNDTKVMSPPVFVFPAQNIKPVKTSNAASNWYVSSVFQTTPVCSTSMFSSVTNPTLAAPKLGDTLDTSRSVVDGLYFAGSSPNTSLNKSRTLSEKSNTSVENYDPCPDFKPIVPLPAEVKVTTGEEDETTIFSSRAKLFRFVEKEWKERGLGEMKLLKHKTTGKVRVLMRREQVHKICANHIITAEMEIKQMKNETKAYFWVANDFADETVVLEKFCIRFKTADIALDFYNAFEKARQESMITKTESPPISKAENLKLTAPKVNSGQLTTQSDDTSAQSFPTTPVKAAVGGFTFGNAQTKATVGGFTFSSTPTFKSVPDSKPATKPQEVAPSKVNVFSGITFKTNTNSPLSNLINLTPANITSPSTSTQALDSSTKLNTSDMVEEYEPNVEFKPIVPLPALVDQKTGEEDETVLFEHRAKLLRFDAATKEWKERGLGNIKLLVHKENIQKLRLLMRREQIMKVCCNHAVTNDMIFQKMPNLDKAVTWCAKDFSEGELVAETFCLRFKTIQLCDEFIEAVKCAQSKIKDEAKAAKEEKNAAKQNNQSGFGDMFKPKSGSWHCDTCYTNNLESFSKCACCETPNPKSIISSNPAPVTNANTAEPVTSGGWGDKFKPKPGSWECKDCFVRNESTLDNCSACNSPKDPRKPKPTVKLTSDSAPKFNFGIPLKTTSNDVTPAPVLPVTTQSIPVNAGGGLFKASPSTGEANNKTSIFDTVASGPQFRFGIPPAANDQKPSTGPTSIFDGTGARKFSFGIPLNNLDTTSGTTTFGDQKSSHNVFGTPNTSVDSTSVDLTLKKNDETTPVKPALLPTPITDSSSNVSFGFKETGTFDFVFKPKTPTKGKSPTKSPHSQGDGDESDGNEYAAEDECYHPFTPVVPLPDKVEVITGEENETELYGQLSKLYRYSSGEWKERGRGIVKILKHKETGKLRVVMRRDQVLKICMNHALTPEITYNPKDEKSWLFAVNDFSEGELNLEHFCLRFKSKEVALEFKDAIDKVLQRKSGGDIKADKKEKEESDDVVFISETQATTEEKQKAKELMLPENFFTYKNKEPCQDCHGCNDSDEFTASTSDIKVSTSSNDAKPSTPIVDLKPVTVAATLKASLATASTTSTPVKTTTPFFQSPTNSLYGTPSNFEKTVDTSIFRTPLGSIGSNAKTPTPTSTQSSFGGNNATNKENTFSQKSNIFSGFGEQNVLFGTPQNNSAESHTTGSAKNSLLAPPKLSNLNTSNESQKDSTSNFGTVQPKFVFSDAKPVVGNNNMGISSNKSIFEFSKNNKKTDSQNSEVKSIFGDDNKSENLFTSVNQGSIFGPGVLANSQSSRTGIFGSANMSAFGTIPSQNQLFGGGKSIFGTSNQAPAFSAVANAELQKVEPVTSNATSDHKPAESNADEEPEKKKKNTVNSGQPTTQSDDTSAQSFPTTPVKAAVGVFTFGNAQTKATVGGFTFSSTPTFKSVPDSKPDTKPQEVAPSKVNFFSGITFITNTNSPLSNLINLTPANITSPSTSTQALDSSTKLNTSDMVEEYEPNVEFKPIVPLPAEVKVTTAIFSSRAKLFRFVEKEWKERGLGEMKLLKHKTTGKVRVLMRREQVHKICANHIITAEMEIKQMKNETKAYFWVANDFADETVVLEKFCIRFKTADIALDFYNAFEKARQESMITKTESPPISKAENLKLTAPKVNSGQPTTQSDDTSAQSFPTTPVKAAVGGFTFGNAQTKATVGGFTFSSTPTFKSVPDSKPDTKPQEVAPSKVNYFSGITFITNTNSPLSNLINLTPANITSPSTSTQALDSSTKLNTSDMVEEYEPNVEFKPIVPLPALVDQKTGEEDETVLFEHRAKLLRFDAATKEWKERGLGNIKLLVHKENIQKLRLLMRREQIMKVCCNHAVTNDMIFQKMPNLDKAVTWCAKDFSEGELVAETFCLRFKTIQLCDEFIEAVKCAQSKIKDEAKAAKEEKNAAKQNNQSGFGDMFKPKSGSWHCDTCYTNNLESFSKCACCETPNPKSIISSNPAPVTNANTAEPVTSGGWGDKFKPKPGSWECKDCDHKPAESNADEEPEKKKKNTVNSGQPTTQSDDTSAQSFPTTPVKAAVGGFTFGNAQTKATVGGFTFSSTPTFKSVPDSKPDTKPQEVAPSKVNFFSGITFITNTNSPLSNLINLTPANITSPSTSTQALDSSTKLNTSDMVEEYEPNVEFKPIVPLPALVDQKTGEEDETVLFEHRAKLLRFDAATKEWKERGLGNIKLLVHKENIQKLRLLMRREQIMKVCCNHAVTNDMIFQKMPNLDKAVTWCAKDFSEGELVAETFCLRFKTIQLCDEFIEAVKCAQSKIKDEAKAAKEEKNAAKQNNQSGFGDMFKPKSGSWHCDTCYTNNLESFSKCACCETPNPKSIISSNPAPVTNANTAEPVTSGGWGDKFKPKPGSWECKDCFVRNESTLDNCSACNSPKDPTKPKPTVKLTSDNAPKFNFGIPLKTTSNDVRPAPVLPVTTQSIPVNAGGGLFKASPSTGEANNKTSIFDTVASGPQFRFGIPPAANDQKPSTGPTSIFDGTGARKFSFGIPLNTLDTTSDTTTFGDQKSSHNVFGTPNTSVDSTSVDLTLKKNDETTPVKPVLLPTPITDSSSNVSFGFKETGTFDFVFKPKTPTKGKSPAKSPHSHGDGDESDGNEYAAEDECYHPFTPVVPLPDTVEVITGEENETELYGQLSKLYRYSSGEWKERGRGIVKILKHKETGKLRVVMRRDQVLKICMNHALTPEITYNPKDEKSWLFAVNDFSEGELNLEHFCLRFKSKEVALEFKDAIDKVLQRKSGGDIKADKKEKEESDDVVFISETQATTEEKQKAKELMLPENFFTYKNKEPCQDCHGCNDSDEFTASTSDIKVSTSSNDAKPSTPIVDLKPVTVAATLKASLATASTTSTPVKTTTPFFQSPTNSLYGTPSNFEKTVDTSIFRTPLGSIGSNAKTPTPTSTQSSFGGNNATNKENTFSQKSNIFSGFGEQNVLFGTPQNNSAESHTTGSAKNSLLAPPKLSNLNTSNESQKDSTSNFGTVQPKFVFSDAKPVVGNNNMGISSNKSIFEFSKNNKKTDSQNSEVKSIFGDDNKSEKGLAG